MQTFLRLLQIVNRLITETETAFHHIFPSLKNGELLALPTPADPTEFLDETYNSNNSTGVAGASSTLKPFIMQKKLRLLGTFISIAFLTIAFSTTSFGQATVTSDADDYAPRSTATFTGAGFEPGEEVILKVKNLSYPCNTVFADSSYLPWTVTADADGGFVTTWLVCECPGDSLRLKATGQTSGSIAYAYFLDNQLGNNAVSIGSPTFATGTGVYGSATVFDYQVNVSSSNGGSANLSTVTLSMTTFPTGITSSMIRFIDIATYGTTNTTKNTLTFGATPSTQSAILRITTQNNTPIPSSANFTVTATPVTGTARSASSTLTITPVTLTAVITADDKFYDGNTDATILTRDVTGEVNGEVIGITGGTATFADKNIGLKTVSAASAGFTLTGGTAANYVLSSNPVTTSATIKPKELIAIFTVANKVYDGNTSATITDRQLSGVISGETNKVDLQGGTATFDTKNVGASKTITVVNPMNLSGTASGNYIIGTVQAGTAAITFRTATIVFTVADKVYDGTTTATIATAIVPPATSDALHGLIAGDNVTVDFSTATVAFNSKDVATTQPQAVTASGFKLTGPDGPTGPAPANGNGNYQVNVVTSFTSSATMSKKPITVSFTASNKVYDGTTSATIASRTLNGVVAADLPPSVPTARVAAAGGTATFSDFNWGTGKTVTASGFGLNGSSQNNYTIVYANAPTNTVTTNADISRRPLTINVVTGQTKVYGQSDPSSYSYNATAFSTTPAQGLATTDAFSGALTRSGGENVANYNILQNGLIIIRSGTSPLLNVSDNYNITYNGTTFGITPLGLTITPGAGQSKVYGQGDPVFGYGFSPALVNGDIATSVFTGKLGRAAGETVAGGPYAYTLGNLSAGDNYTLSLSTQTPLSTFSITPLGLTIKPTAGQSKVYGQSDPSPFAYTFTPALVNGDVATSVFSGALGRIAGENVADGPYAYTLGNLSAGTNYSLSLSTTVPLSTFAITQKALTVTADPKSVQYSDILTFSVTITGFATVNGVPETLATSGVSGQASFTAQPISPTSQALSLSSSNAVLSGPGTYTITPALGTLSASNYSFSFATGTLTVTQENARAYYTGALFASTSSTSSSTATVTLSATIKDITAVDNASDPNPGDIRNATVQFVDRTTNLIIGTAALTFLPIGLVDGNDIKVGTATVNWTADIGSGDSKDFTIGIIVSGYYTRNCSEENTIVTISKPIPGMITGGGYVVVKNSSGQKAGTVDTKNNFGFNVKLGKSSPQGNINTIIRRMEPDNVMHVYQIKGNSMTSLSIKGATSNPPVPGTATFNGKANIQDITNPLNVIPVDGNATLQVTMTDMGEPGENDKIAITVWNKSGGLWFANNWDGTKTQEQKLDGGNLKVSSTTASGIGTAQPKVLLISSLNPSAVGQSVTFTANVSASTMPTGKVAFYDYTTNILLTGVTPVALNASGIASFTTNSLSSGSHKIVAYYGGDIKYNVGSASLTQVVNVVVSSPSAVDPSTILQMYDKFDVKVLQNPSPTYFTVRVTSSDAAPVEILVYDINGRKVRQYRGAVGESIRIGHSLLQGTYFVQVLQGKNKSVTKVIKN